MPGKLSIIIPVLNDTRIRDCLRSLYSQIGAQHSDVEVIVVDNGPSEQVHGIVGEFPARYVIETRRGSYAARNRGINEAHGEILAFTDSDCILPAGWVDSILSRAPDNAIAIGPSYSIGSSRVALWVQSVDDARTAAVHGDNPIVFCDTRNLAGPAELFKTLRFDPDFMETGDLEFALRLTAEGKEIRYVPDMILGHDNPATLRGALWRAIRRGRCITGLYRKHGDDIRLSGERELRIFGRNQKHLLLRFLRKPASRALGIAAAPVLLALMLGALSVLRWAPVPASWGMQPYRILDRGALLFGILLGSNGNGRHS